MDSTWPEGQRRQEDHTWYGVVGQYNGVILLVITIVLIVGGIMTWMDRRDYQKAFRDMATNISDLSNQIAGMKEVLPRIDRQVGVLSHQNEKWISWERELIELREQGKANRQGIQSLRERLQRLEDREEDGRRQKSMLELPYTYRAIGRIHTSG